MKKISVLLTVVILAVGTMLSCKEKAEKKEDKPHSSHEHKHGDHDHPEEGHHHGREGDRKGPPGGGHSPEQTKTLEEIGGYKIGDTATDFNLKSVDGSMVSLAGIDNAKGYIVAFTCNECPFSKMYEDRLIELHNNYASKGYPVIAINPNNPENVKEGYEAMQKRAKEKGFPFAYVVDEAQKLYPKYGAVRTPHVFLLDKNLKVQYIGSIDDNAKSPENVKVKYVENAIKALENGETPNPSLTKAIGCPIKSGKH